MQCGSLYNFTLKFPTELCLIYSGLRGFTIRFHKFPLFNDNDNNDNNDADMIIIYNNDNYDDHYRGCPKNWQFLSNVV